MLLYQNDLSTSLYVVEVISKFVYIPKIVKTSNIEGYVFDDHIVWKGPTSGGLSMRSLDVFIGEEFLRGECRSALPLFGLLLLLRLLQLLDVLAEGEEALALRVTGLEFSSLSAVVFKSRSKMR